MEGTGEKTEKKVALNTVVVEDLTEKMALEPRLLSASFFSTPNILYI